MKFISRLRAAARKPLGVIGFRVRQELTLAILRAAGHWGKCEEVARLKSQNVDISCVAASINDKVPWFDVSDYGDICTRRFTERTLTEVCDEIESGTIKVFGNKVSIPTGPGWHHDDVFDMIWPPRYFRSYDFYEKRCRPYDVKRVWEPSRLSFLGPMALGSLLINDLDKKRDWLKFIYDILTDWIAYNPVAYSVNWYPMEASVRLINLSLVFGIVSRMPESDDRNDILRHLYFMLLTHLEFVSRNIEYSDIRGNHYAANIVAIAVGSCVTEGFEEGKSRLKQFAFDEIEREIMLQFFDDGLNFEKSFPYHLFVLELFFVGAVTYSWFGDGLSKRSIDRLTFAADMMAEVRRPDGLIPVLGDNDSARILTLGLEAPRSPDGLLAAFQAFTACAASWSYDETLLGALVTNQDTPERNPVDVPSGVRVFPRSGIAVIRGAAAYVFVNFGRIGLCGRGGHSHNDMLSFELTLASHAIVVDRGCPTYTGDLNKRDEFRSSRSHNTLCPDDDEHAKLLGPWLIEDRARAQLLDTSAIDDWHSIVLENQTFSGDTPPLLHTRKVCLSADGRAFKCLDDVNPCGVLRRIVRYFQFGPDCRICCEQDDGSLVISCDNLRVEITPSQTEECTWFRRDVSCNYDESKEAYALRLISHLDEPTILSFTAKLLNQNDETNSARR